MKKSLILLLLTLLYFPLMGQKGLVRGTLYDGDTGEPVPFATVYLESDKGIGTSTDLDGTFEFQLPAKIYSITFSYIGYTSTTVHDLEVREDAIQVINPNIYPAMETLSEIVVVASQIRNTQSALLTIKRKSPNVVDGVSRELFSKTGDGDAGSAIKRVTGVSVVNGKHVLVRGLGDRYSKTVLNGTEIPGLDPDKNSVQFDLFPTLIIENILISKTFMPNLPGDFSGGLVNIYTREFPESPLFRISASVGYNPSMNLVNNFLSYDGSKTDALGWDNGSRDLPFEKTTNIPDPIHKNHQLSTLTSQFNPRMSSMEVKSAPDQSYSIVYGNQFDLGSGKLGIIGTANYKVSYRTFPELEYNTYLKYPDTANFNLLRNRSIHGRRSDQEVLLTGIAGINYKLKRTKIGINWFHIQNGTSRAAKLDQINSETNPSTIVKTNLGYRERSMDHIRVNGKHHMGSDNWELDWTLSQTKSTLKEPDNRVTTYQTLDRGEEISYELNASVGGGVHRVWRTLQEDNYAGMLDVSYAIDSQNNRTSYIRGGGGMTYKDRRYEILNYLFRVEQSGKIGLNGDPDQLFLPQNIWDPNSRTGTYVRGNYEPANTYKANQTIFAGYVMNDLSLGSRLKTIYGARMEQVVNRYTGQNNLGSERYENQKVFDQLDILPSFNIIYAATDKINIRLSANRTLARPTFKEKSLAQIQDLISGKTFIGNLNLDATEINNFDLRFENYFDLGQLVSLSGFYKQLFAPIELVAYSDASPDNVQPRNSTKATILGIELELKKNLAFMAPVLQGATLSGNVSFIRSNVKLGESEYQSRLHNARSGELISSTRSLVDQAPVIANVFLQYATLNKLLDLNLSYNYQGKQLTIVGIGRNSDIYTQPTHSLNFTARMNMKKTNRVHLSLLIKNILDHEHIQVYQSYGSIDRISERYRPGRSVSLGLSVAL
ncbi:TonB-dependent receptor [Membranicola marinus]|uniref:TonB-dependent receptor n=1 Tax=Membranihabitans marinus TaxID=1227546 RepID=A0A953LAM0_9BACT|nr:TonB-dependent receptor [Membranihabitans marinus]MBY5960105.1 TonB-dependent receptor [Membranihabitans marinus]